MKFSYVINNSVSKIDIDSKKIVKNIFEQFLIGSKIVYITRKQDFIGVITYENLKNNNFNVYSSIKKDYPFIIADGKTEKKELEKYYIIIKK